MKRLSLILALSVLALIASGCGKTDRYELATVGHGDKFEAFLLNKETGQVWQFMPDRTWGKIPEPPQNGH